MYAQIFLVTSVRGAFFTPQIFANSALVIVVFFVVVVGAVVFVVVVMAVKG